MEKKEVMSHHGKKLFKNGSREYTHPNKLGLYEWTIVHDYYNIIVRDGEIYTQHDEFNEGKEKLYATKEVEGPFNVFTKEGIKKRSRASVD